jgi:formylglycine-generating enzyme required for sulfatase activity
MPALRHFTSSRVAFVVASIALGAVACIDAPNLDPGTTTSSSATDPSGAGGGASAISGAHDGMVLVPAVTLAVGTSVSPTSVDPAAKGGDGMGGAKPPKGGDGKGGDGKGGGANGMDAGAGGGTGDTGAGGDTGGSSGTGTGGAPTQVAVPEFWLDSTEVTVAAYRACIAAGTCAAPATDAGCTLAAGLDTHPVSCVSPDQARAYCTWIGKRLVRNDEWTAAALGASSRTYPWGSESPAADRLDACGPECAESGGSPMYGASDGYATTAPVGSFPLGSTPDGVLDLAGNVAEWVDGTLAPVARGGSYADVATSAVTSANAGVGAPNGPTVGFRCAADR